MIRQVDYEDLNRLCRGITRSFAHLETRDAYGTDVELPHLAAWRRGEEDDLAWLGWWVQMLRGHVAAGRVCRRLRVVSEPVSEYQQWTRSHVTVLEQAGEQIQYLPRRQATGLLLPGSGDFYVFDDELVMFLHYSGSGLNTAFELEDDPGTVARCAEVFQSAWDLAVPAGEYRPE